MTNCYHCGLPVTETDKYTLPIAGEAQQMCCLGCLTVASFIISNELQDYYNFRDQLASSQENNKSEDYNYVDEPAIYEEYVHEDGESSYSTVLLIDNINCAACVWLIEGLVEKLPGIKKFSINLINHRARLTWDPGQIKLSELFKKIANLGYKANFDSPVLQENLIRAEKRYLLRSLALSGLAMMQVMTFAVSLYLGAFQGIDDQYKILFFYVSLVVTTPVLLYSGMPFLVGAWRNLRNKSIGMDVTISIALVSAYGISVYNTIMGLEHVYFDSICMFIFLLTLGRYLEVSARSRCGDSLQRLHTILPTTVTVIQEDGFLVKRLSELKKGERVQIKPGEIIPADGLVVSGISSINEKLFTGELSPKLKTIGDKLIAGMENIDSVLEMDVEENGHGTVLSNIMTLLDRAQSEKPKIIGLAQQVTGYFVSIVILLAVVSLGIWWQIDSARAFAISFAVLVISCPCALSLATPMALTACTNYLAKYGFLVTRGHVIETLAEVDTVVFDKTGTLTAGKYQVEVVELADNVDFKQAISVVASIEANSEHPIAKAFVAYAKDKNIQLVKASDVKNAINQGIEAKIDEKTYRVGTEKYVSQLLGSLFVIEPQNPGLWVLLADEQRVLGKFKLHDPVRNEALEAIQNLQQLKLKLHILSGDSSDQVDKIGHALAIRHVRSGASPQDKYLYLQELQRAGAKVAMVGDGVNDTPGLNLANVSVAMGDACDLTKFNADSVLLNNDLCKLVDAVKICRFAKLIIKENLLWAIGYNLLALPLAACGMIAPYFSVIGMTASSLIVIGNSLRLNRRRNKALAVSSEPAVIGNSAFGVGK